MKRPKPRDRAPQAAEILIYGDIGEGWFAESNNTVKRVKEQLDALGEQPEVVVRINSPGGDAFEGIAIYNVLRDAPQRVVVKVDGTAVSAASIVAMAGDEIRMAENALLMIHDPWTMTMGDASDLRQTADLLDKVAGAIAQTYVARSGQDAEDVREMMAAETWFDAAEALEAGFATHVDGRVDEALATLTARHIAAYKNAPERAEQWARQRDEQGARSPFELRIAAAQITTPAIERGEDHQPIGEDAMKIEEIQAALDRANEQLAGLRTERDTAVARATAIEVQNATLAAERDAAVAKATELEHNAIVAEVRALIGVKFTAAEVEDQIALCKRDRQLFDRLTAQRSAMTLLTKDPAGMGPNPAPRPAAADADGAGFANLIDAALNG